jgi:glycosyltransferase involved in cell wall biosynthesis
VQICWLTHFFNVNNLRSTPPALLISGHDLRFLRPFIAHCENILGYRVYLEQHHGHNITAPDQCLQMLPLADIIFCEWCLGNAVWYSNHKLDRQRLIVRLHSQELKLPFLERVQWSQVDALIVICPRNHELMLDRYPFLQDKVHLIYNPIDCRGLRQAKLPGAEFNLGMLGMSPKLKAPHLAFDIFSRLKQIDRRYTLYIKGKPPREYDWLWRRRDERAYYEQFHETIGSSPFKDSVVFESYGDDVSQWFSKIGFILSTSDTEGSHQSVAEGMASGAIPVIRDWPGADLIYPVKYVARSVEAAVESILLWRSPKHYAAEAKFCRAFAHSHFDQGRVCRQFEALMHGALPAATRGRWPRRSKLAGQGQLSIAALKPLAVNGRALRLPAQARDQAPAAACSLASVSRPINREDRERLKPNPILVLGYIPAGFRGGYRIRIEQEIRALTKHGLTVHLACLHPETDDVSAMTNHRAELATLGCPVHLVAIKGFFDLKLDEGKVGAPMDILQRLVAEHQFRIVHAEALYCARIGLNLKARCAELGLVFDCHGTSPEEERMSGAHPSRISAMQEWEFRAVSEADLNVFVSEAMHQYYCKTYGFSQLRHAVVPCCVAEERFTEGIPPPAAVGSLPPDRLVLVYLGTMAAWQCGEEMIRLFAQLRRRSPRFFFLMLVPQADHPKALSMLAKHHVPSHDVLLLEVPHNQVISALQQAHAGALLRRVHPVNEVSSPTKFGEYLAAGLPVIITPGVGDFSQLVIDQEVGLVLDPALLESICCAPRQLDRIAKLMHESADHRDRVAARCRAVARERLHWNGASATLAEHYQQIIRPRTQPHFQRSPQEVNISP